VHYCTPFPTRLRNLRPLLHAIRECRWLFFLKKTCHVKLTEYPNTPGVCPKIIGWRCPRKKGVETVAVRSTPTRPKRGAAQTSTVARVSRLVSMDHAAESTSERERSVPRTACAPKLSRAAAHAILSIQHKANASVYGTATQRKASIPPRKSISMEREQEKKREKKLIILYYGQDGWAHARRNPVAFLRGHARPGPARPTGLLSSTGCMHLSSAGPRTRGPRPRPITNVRGIRPASLAPSCCRRRRELVDGSRRTLTQTASRARHLPCQVRSKTRPRTSPDGNRSGGRKQVRQGSPPRGVLG
jgi:hypothetical protein